MALTRLEEQDVKLHVLYEMGVAMREIAAMLGREENTLYKRRLRTKEQFEWLGAIVRAQLEAVIAKRVQKIQENADIKGRINKKSYEALEKLVDRKDTPEFVDVLLLGSLKEGIDRTEGKALDRKAILQRNEKITRTEVSIDDLAEFMEEVRRLNSPSETPLLTAATEAELVGPSN